MAIALDSTSNGTNIVSPNGSWSHTCSGTDRYLFVFVNQNASSVTYNSISMTKLLTVPATNCTIWGLASPTTGTNTVLVTSGSNCQGISVSYTGVGQTGQPEANTTTNTGSAAVTVSNSVTTITDKAWVIGFAIRGGSTNSMVAGSGATQRAVRACSITFGSGISIYDSNAPKTPAGSYSMTVNTDSGSDQLLLTSFSVFPSVPNFGALLLAQMAG